MVSVWFVCNSCGSMSYRTVDEFLEHKKQKHFLEFQKIRCILFEDIKSDEIVQLEDVESLSSKLNSNTPYAPKLKEQHNPNHQTETNPEAGNNSLDFVFEENNSNTFAKALSESELNFDPDIDDPFIEPKVEITVLDEDIDVDLNVNGAAWGETTATTSTAETGPGSDAAAYTDFVLRYSPFIPLKRLTPQEIEDAAAAVKLNLNNSIDPLGRQLLEVGNQKHSSNLLDASFMNRTGTGSKFLDDRYQVNLNDEGHIFFAPNNLHQNVDLPFGENSIVCSLCKFVTDSKVSLKNHMKIHSKALMCSHVDCFASFDTGPLLQQHYSGWHSPLKPYRCSYADCYKAYAYTADLKLHSLDHSGERPFPCTQENCSAEFKTKRYLEHHTSSAHSNARPFKCPKKGCASAFGHVDYLNSHLRNHPTKKYSCRNCRKRFLGWLSFKKHRTDGCCSDTEAGTPLI